MRARPPSREKLVYASDYGRVINDALTNKVESEKWLIKHLWPKVEKLEQKKNQDINKYFFGILLLENPVWIFIYTVEDNACKIMDSVCSFYIFL